MPAPASPPRRGGIWMVDFGESIGHEQGNRRPALIVSADRLNASQAGLVVIVPLTRTRRGLPSHIKLETGATGLADTSYAKTEDVKSVSTQRLIRQLGRAEPDTLRQVARTLGWLLEII